MTRALLLTVPFLCFLAPAAHAHPVPKGTHDRTIVVRFTRADDKSDVVRVDYRLEVDELTVLLDDLPPFRDEIDVSRFKDKREELYAEFTRVYAPILAANLVAKLNGRALEFQCVRREHRLHDDKGKPLGHLRCDFVFQAPLPVAANRDNEFRFREGNYELQAGKIDLRFANDLGLQILEKTEPDEALKDRPETQLRPGDEDRLRTLAVKFVSAASPPAAEPPREVPQPTPVQPEASAAPAEAVGSGEPFSALRVFMEWKGSFWVLLLVMAGVGAAHALTPGHGKTLVAAYLVGEHGTTAHALVLGLVTTFTHTAVVLAIALLLLLVPADLHEDTRGNLQTGLQVGMGLLVALTGAWLLLQRLAGRADHVHIGGHGHQHHHGHHHHPHGPADHDHDADGNVIPRAPRPVGWWGLIVMGMTGGIVPCWDALGVLTVAVASGEFWMGPLLVLAFSAGLAGVLVLIGVLVIHARNFARSRWGEGPLVRALPLLSAVLVLGMGLWLCYDGVQAQGAHGRPAASARP